MDDSQNDNSQQNLMMIAMVLQRSGSELHREDISLDEYRRIAFECCEPLLASFRLIFDLLDEESKKEYYNIPGDAELEIIKNWTRRHRAAR